MPTKKSSASKAKPAPKLAPVKRTGDRPALKAPLKKLVVVAPPTKKAAPKPVAKKSAASKRELLEPTTGDKRFVRRKPDGQFGKTVDVGKSLSADSRSKAKTKVPKGQGDRGDTKR